MHRNNISNKKTTYFFFYFICILNVFFIIYILYVLAENWQYEYIRSLILKLIDTI